MTTLLTTLIFLIGIGFMWGGFITLIITTLAIVVGYFTGIFGVLSVVLIIFVGSAIYKFGIIDFVKNLKR